MFKTQLRFQKILSYALLAVAVLTFIYALGVMTSIYEALFQACDIGHIPGAELFYDMQDFNKQLLALSIVTILASLSIFVTNGHKRRKYYIGNYIAVGICGAVDIAVSVFIAINVTTYRAAFLKVDFEALKTFAEKWDTYYTESTVSFDIGYVLCALLVVVTVVSVLNVIWKVNLMKQEERLLNGEEVAAQ